MSQKDQLHTLIEQLPDCELPAVAKYLESLLPREAPIEREAPVEEDMLERIDLARANPSPGITHRDVLREFGL